MWQSEHLSPTPQWRCRPASCAMQFKHVCLELPDVSCWQAQASRIFTRKLHMARTAKWETAVSPDCIRQIPCKEGLERPEILKTGSDHDTSKLTLPAASTCSEPAKSPGHSRALSFQGMGQACLPGCAAREADRQALSSSAFEAAGV